MKTKIKIYGIIVSAFLITSCAVAGVNKIPARSDCDSLETLKALQFVFRISQE